MVAGPITVVQMLPGLSEGGVERGTLEMGAFLSRKGHRSIVVSEGGRLVPRLEAEGSIHLKWRAGAKNPISLAYLIPLRRLMIREKVDILHLRSRMPAWIGYLAWKSLPSRLRPILVTTFHGFYSINPYSAIMAKGEKVIAISQTVSAHIQDKYGIPKDRITIIYRGFDKALFDPDLVSEKRISSLKERWSLSDPAGPLLMLPGRIAKWKGQDIFIKSLSRIKHLPWTALCVGGYRSGQTYAEKLMALISRLELNDRVRLVGHCDDMPAALALSDVVVSASSTEPEAFGRVAVEAQAMGKPVVASAHGGSLETVLPEKTGWLVTPCDPVSMANALAQAISNEAMRQTYGKNGINWVKENFTADKMCTETLALYDDLLEKRCRQG